jgi:hypothetical protein
LPFTPQFTGTIRKFYPLKAGSSRYDDYFSIGRRSAASLPFFDGRVIPLG